MGSRPLCASAIRVRHDPRPFGESNYTFSKLVTHSLNMFTGFSALPLQVASILGFALTFFGAGLLAYVLIRYVVAGVSVPFPVPPSTARCRATRRNPRHLLRPLSPVA